MFYPLIICDFLFYGYPCLKKDTWRYSARKVRVFGLLVTNIPVYVSCKFEMYIFKISLVINENVCFAFLYVLSIFEFQRYM